MSSDIYILLIIGVPLILLAAYTKNVQFTTLELGKKLTLGIPSLSTGLQDAITPRWQTRNNVLFFILTALFVIESFLVLQWYYAILAVLVVVCLISLVSMTVMPKPMSPKLIQAIRSDLEKRRDNYQRKGDDQRKDSADMVLELLNDYEHDISK